MFFGWVTPALMAFIAHHLATEIGRPVRGARYAIGAAFVAALAAYPAFLMFGYAPAEIGGARVPASVIAAGLNVIAWYAFAVQYWKARAGGTRTLSTGLLDLSVLFLVGASLGAWGLPLVQIFSPENQVLKTALTHIFLDWTSEGWFVLGILGLGASGCSQDRRTTWALRGIAAGLPFTFALGMPWSVVPVVFKVLASAGGLLVAVGLLILAKGLWPHLSGVLWRFALAMLAVKAVILGVSSLIPSGSWIGIHAYRILYIHITLLGFVSVGLLAVARDFLGRRATHLKTAFTAAVGIMLVSLLPLTPLWPLELAGRWALFLAGFAGLAVVLATIPMLASQLRKPHQ